MLVIGSKTGRLGNRLKLFAHLIGNAMENHYRIINPSFCEYSHYFLHTSKRIIPSFPKNQVKVCFAELMYPIIYYIFLVIARLARILPKILKPVRVVNITKEYDAQGRVFDLCNEAFQQMVAQTAVVIARGWSFRDNQNVKKHADAIRDYFILEPEFATTVNKIITDLRQKYDCLIGVHIRLGDYLSYRNGEYYFQPDTYLNSMKASLKLLGYESICFLLCSDENLDRSYFKNLTCYYSSEIEIVDLYLLANCDYLIAPPSSFSGWASFWGKTPLFTINKTKPPSSLNDFIIKML